MFKEIAQVWFADDSCGAGVLEKLKLWWDRLNVVGPKNGYHPKPSKTYLIVKSQDLVEKAKLIFETDGLQEDDIKINSFVKHHVGAVVRRPNSPTRLGPMERRTAEMSNYWDTL